MILLSNLAQWGDISQDVFEFLTARLLPSRFSRNCGLYPSNSQSQVAHLTVIPIPSMVVGIRACMLQHCVGFLIFAGMTACFAKVSFRVV